MLSNATYYDNINVLVYMQLSLTGGEFGLCTSSSCVRTFDASHVLGDDLIENIELKVIRSPQLIRVIHVKKQTILVMILSRRKWLRLLPVSIQMKCC